ncbi:hypothetical protein HYU94_00065 [Candidatus Daviesbacteria bacterium]|nr:hypothetical protein [Candidatus Daviesbacteria bacterium]
MEPNSQAVNPQKSNKGKIIKILILVFLGLILIPILYIALKLTLTGAVIYKNLSKLPKSTPQTNYVNTSSSSDNKPEQIRKQARNERRKLDIDSMAKALENNFGSEEQNKYPTPEDDWFAAGAVPKDPLGEEYLGIPKENVSNFNICANLEDAIPNQYCVKSKQSP